MFLILLAAYSKLCTATLYEGESYVKTFDKHSSFEKEVVKGDGVWMIKFFSPTCPHCKNMVKEYARVGEVGRGILNVGAVDMSTPSGQRIGAIYKVDSYPTILVVGDDAEPIVYTGKRKAQDMFNELLQVTMNVLQKRAGPPNANEGHHPGGVESKVVVLNTDNFQKEVLDNPLVSAIACKLLFYSLRTTKICSHSLISF